MPNIVEVSQKKKKFVKVSYRAWRFSSEDSLLSINLKENSNESKATITNRNHINKVLIVEPQKIEGSSCVGSIVKSTIIIPLAGKELKLLFFLCNLCIQNCSLRTPEVATNELNSLLNVNSNRLRNIILRITKKNLIKVVNRKCGANAAYRVFEFSKQVYDKLLYKLTAGNSLEDLGDQLSSGMFSMVRGNTDTTVNREQEFKNIDYSALSSIGFNQSHLIQVQREYQTKPSATLPFNIIQDSISAMAFDLKHNNVAKDFKISPAAVLTSLLKRGIPYSSKTPEKFKTPQQEAMDEFLSFQEKKNNLNKQRENRTKNLEFEKWQKDLTEEKLLELCPESNVVAVSKKIRKTIRMRKARELSKDYFDIEIWPERKRVVENQMNVILDQGKTETR